MENAPASFPAEALITFYPKKRDRAKLAFYFDSEIPVNAIEN